MDTKLFINGKPYNFIPSPYVLSDCLSQMGFVENLINLQRIKTWPELSSNLYAKRLSCIRSVNHLAVNTCQWLLEDFSNTNSYWNMNYGPHGWHSYPGGLAPHLVRAILNFFKADRNTIVLDPFVGGGTTLVEARLLGIPAIGIDICPLACLITRAKSQFPLQTHFIDDILKDIVGSSSKIQPTRYNMVNPERQMLCKTFCHEIDVKNSAHSLEQFLSPEVFMDICNIVQYCNKLQGYPKDFLLMILSGQIEKYANINIDVLNKKYTWTSQKSVDLIELIHSQLKKVKSSIGVSFGTHREFISNDANICVLEGDALSLDIDRSSIDYVITSPPYGTEASWYLSPNYLSYLFIHNPLNPEGYTYWDKLDKRGYIAHYEKSEIDNKILDKMSYTYNGFFKKLRMKKFHSQFDDTIDTVESFFKDMYRFGSRLRHWLKTDSKVAIIIGDIKINRYEVPTDKILAEIFRNFGLCLEKIWVTKLPYIDTGDRVSKFTKQKQRVLFFRCVA